MGLLCDGRSLALLLCRLAWIVVVGFRRGCGTYCTSPTIPTHSKTMTDGCTDGSMMLFSVTHNVPKQPIWFQLRPLLHYDIYQVVSLVIVFIIAVIRIRVKNCLALP